jgi:murein DD-endopeptidase MepM/ murein hydrolase activator NlpD
MPGLADRLLTIVITATVTSAAWIVAAGFGLAPQFHRFVGTQGRTVATVPASGPAVTAAPARVPAPAVTSSRGLVIPVAGIVPGQLTDTFTVARNGGRHHDAIDIMAPAGTPVIAAAAGTVEKLFLSKAGGNTIYVRSPDRTTLYYYAHLQDYAAGLHEGQAVRQGDTLGRVGSTGDANPAAPHLHFQVLQTNPQAKWWEPNTALNPYPMLAH